MQLSFRVAVVGSGNYPDFVQFERIEGELFFVMRGKCMVLRPKSCMVL